MTLENGLKIVKILHKDGITFQDHFFSMTKTHWFYLKKLVEVLNKCIQIITIGTICGNANEGSTLELSCQEEHIISEIQFASYGDPKLKCGLFKPDLCDVTNNALLVEKACIGMDNCSIDVYADVFGLDNAINLFARLVVQALCSKNSKN